MRISQRIHPQIWMLRTSCACPSLPRLTFSCPDLPEASRNRPGTSDGARSPEELAYRPEDESNSKITGLRFEQEFNGPDNPSAYLAATKEVSRGEERPLVEMPGETMSDIWQLAFRALLVSSVPRSSKFRRPISSSSTGELGRHTSGHGKGYPARDIRGRLSGSATSADRLRTRGTK